MLLALVSVCLLVAFDVSGEADVSVEKRVYGPYDGQFCCSPSCDRHMADNKIKPRFVECQFNENRSKFKIRDGGVGVVDVKINKD
uniref:Uncharacterized protein n=1 Tax=Aurelia aurita TaxID=6145 RepID=R9S1Q3_AURAU|nr:hypothetical protein [Aurelia aurita]